jgi:hypothetical protein
MNPKTIYRIQDALAKLNAKTQLVSGGSQFTPDVSLAVAGMNRGKAMMRNQKPEGARPLPLRELTRGKK